MILLFFVIFRPFRIASERQNKQKMFFLFQAVFRIYLYFGIENMVSIQSDHFQTNFEQRALSCYKKEELKIIQYLQRELNPQPSRNYFDTTLLLQNGSQKTILPVYCAKRRFCYFLPDRKNDL